MWSTIYNTGLIKYANNVCVFITLAHNSFVKFIFELIELWEKFSLDVVISKKNMSFYPGK